MARKVKQQNSCHTGKVYYRTKADAEAASPKGKAVKCNGCRGWHAKGGR